MNAAAGLYVAGEVPTFEDGITLAIDVIDSGKALKALDRLISVSNA